MKTIYLSKGIAYINKDLAILSGATLSEITELKLNDSEDFEVKTNFYNIIIEDELENEIVLETNKDFEYLALKEYIQGLSKEAKRKIDRSIEDFSEEFDPSDFFNTND